MISSERLSNRYSCRRALEHELAEFRFAHWEWLADGGQGAAAVAAEPHVYAELRGALLERNEPFHQFVIGRQRRERDPLRHRTLHAHRNFPGR